jgi:hypothetical protein
LFVAFPYITSYASSGLRLHVLHGLGAPDRRRYIEDIRLQSSGVVGRWEGIA